jgi:NTE family protein
VNGGNRERGSQVGGQIRQALAPLTQRLRRRRVAFVFSGGGNLGAVQVGMLRALVEAGVEPDLIVGCSVGAINGAAYAADPTLRGIARLERLWRRLATGNPEIMPGSIIPLAVQLARRGQSLHDPARLEQLLDEELPATRFSDLRIPFHCVATDLANAAEHWFDSGPLIPALMASASLPAVFPERDIGGRQLIDGGVLNEIHAHRAVALGATELYVLHVGHLTERNQPVQRPFDAAMRAYWTARRYRLHDDLRRIPAHCVVHLLPAGDTPRLRFDDFSRTTELMAAAYTATSAHLGRGPIDDRAEPEPKPTTTGAEGIEGVEPPTASAVGPDRRPGIEPI